MYNFGIFIMWMISNEFSFCICNIFIERNKFFFSFTSTINILIPELLDVFIWFGCCCFCFCYDYIIFFPIFFHQYLLYRNVNAFELINIRYSYNSFIVFLKDLLFYFSCNTTQSIFKDVEIVDGKYGDIEIQ